MSVEKVKYDKHGNRVDSVSVVHKSKIGGQALFEGVMMRGSGKEAMAVRKKDGSIYTEEKTIPTNRWYQKTLFIRGVFNFIIQMKNGYNYMMRSMDISGFLDEDDGENNAECRMQNAEIDKNEECRMQNAEIVEDETSFELETSDEPETPEKKDDSKSDMLITIVGVVGGVALAIFLFMFVPNWTATAVDSAVQQDMSGYHSLIAGIIRIILFVIYMWAISLMKDIRTTYEYHGAEHKVIAAYEAGVELTPENVQKQRRFHPRCGTSFIFLVLAVSILIYSILPFSPQNIARFAEEQGIEIGMGLANVLRTVIQLMLLPFLVGITYEIIKLAGRYDRNIVMRIISAPGLGLQRLTTKEPTEKQIEVAIAAVLPVLPDNKEDDKY